MSISAVVALVKDVWWVLSVPMGFVGLLGMLYLRSQFPTRAQHEAAMAGIRGDVAKLGERMSQSERHAQRMEADMRQLPTRAEFAALGERISRLETAVSTSAEMVRGIEKTVARSDATLSMIVNHMMHREKDQ